MSREQKAKKFREDNWRKINEFSGYADESDPDYERPDVYAAAEYGFVMGYRAALLDTENNKTNPSRELKK